MSGLTWSVGGLFDSAFSGRSAELHEMSTVRQSTVGLRLNNKPQTWERLNAPSIHMEVRTREIVVFSKVTSIGLNG